MTGLHRTRIEALPPPTLSSLLFKSVVVAAERFERGGLEDPSLEKKTCMRREEAGRREVDPPTSPPPLSVAAMYGPSCGACVRFSVVIPVTNKTCSLFFVHRLLRSNLFFKKARGSLGLQTQFYTPGGPHYTTHGTTTVDTIV
jgi:hypothetical protein